VIHNKRTYCVYNVDTPEQLTDKLKSHSWTCCAGFRLQGYLFLNDSFSEDGASEWAVFKEATGKQVESITFGWCDRANTLRYIRESIAGMYDGWAERLDGGPMPKIEEAGNGHSCILCA